MTKKVTKDNCLATLFPKLSTEWCHERNDGLTPEDVLPGSDIKVWWKCCKADDHVWQARIYRRTYAKKPSGCPYCAGQKVSASNCLETTHPELALQWDHHSNGAKTPQNITAGHNGKVHWICPENPFHKWQAKVSLRTSASTGCPYCASQRVDITKSLEAKYPQISQYWHSTLNGALSAAQVLPQSNQLVWWQCPAANDHVWSTTVYSAIKTNSFCPFCSGRKASKESSLATTHPKLAEQWHPDKNGTLAPTLITSRYGKPVWWKCPAANDHEWEAKPSKRTNNNNGCPICANRKIVKSNCLETTHPEMAAQWHPTRNHQRTPRNTAVGYGREVWWQCCHNPEHIWQTSPVSRKNNNSGCPYCSNRKVSKTNNLAVTYPKIALEWHPELNGSLTPEDIVPGSPKKVWWQCTNNPSHVWEAKIEHRTRLDSGCPDCSNSVSKEATLIFQKLSSLVRGLLYEGQEGVDASALKIPTWRRSFDAAIPHLSLFIEYDGVYYHQNQKERDIRKNEAAEKLGYTVLRIRPEPLEKIRDSDIQVPPSYNSNKYVEIIMTHLRKMFPSKF